MNWPTQIVIVRHAESEGNVKLCEDASFTNKANHNFAITERGKKQAQITGEYVRSRYGKFDGYICSTFRRTQETMSVMYPEVVPVIDSRLDEMWRGIWHTMAEEEITKCYPKEKEIRDREGWYHYRAPGGQNGQDVEHLVCSFLLHLREFYAGKRILIVGHGTWMIFLWRVMFNRSIAEAEAKYKSDKYKNASVTVLAGENGQLKLVIDNYVPIANRINCRKEWFDLYSTTPEEVEKTADDLRVFMTTDRWQKLLASLKQSRQRIKVYEWQDACDDYEVMYLTGDGFVNNYGRLFTDPVEIVEDFMTHDFYGARKPEENKCVGRHPKEFFPWLDYYCAQWGVPK